MGESLGNLEVIERIFRSNVELAASIRKIVERYAEKLKERGLKRVRIMNFCGTHEWTTVHYGLRSLLPKNVELVAGPGCPVCVTPSKYVSHAIKLVSEGITVFTFGDAYKLPTTTPVSGMRNLAEAKAEGYDVRVVYGFSDCLKDLRNVREAVFLAIGFETTAPSYAFPLKSGMVPKPLRLIPALRLTPPVAEYVVEKIREMKKEPVDAIIAPGHVSAIIGGKPWDELGKKLGMPVVVSGFEPIDVLLSVSEILKMLYDGEVGGRIEYKRVVSWEGNKEALKAMDEVFRVVDAGWRGIGYVPGSGLVLSEEYAEYDAMEYYGLEHPSEAEVMEDVMEGCLCHEIVMGLAKPTDCPFFMKSCTPDSPVGPCMVSIEGTCMVWARFGGNVEKELLGGLECA